MFSFVSWKHRWEEKLFCVLCKEPFNVWALSALFCSFTFPQVSLSVRRIVLSTWKAENLRVPHWRRGSLGNGESIRHTKKTLKQHQGAKEGPQMCWSGAETHLDTPSLRLETSSPCAEMAACFAGRCCVLSSCDAGVCLVWLTVQRDTAELNHRGVIKEVCVQEHSENLKENRVMRDSESCKGSGS